MDTPKQLYARMAGIPMRSSTINQVKLDFYKSASIAGTGFLALTINGCAVAQVAGGKIISTRQNTFYTSPGSGKKIILNASPAISTGLSEGQWQQVIAVNGKSAWVKISSKVLGKVRIKPRTKPLQLTANSTEQTPPAEHKWLTIKNDMNWHLTGATRETFADSPEYIKEQGRSILLPANYSPFQLPEVRLQSNKVTGWARILDLNFSSDGPVDKNQYYGIVLQPFLGIFHTDYRKLLPGKTVVIRYFAFRKPLSTSLSSLHWELQSALFLPAKTSSQIQSVGFASDSKQQSYLFTVLWKNKRVYYFGFSGRTYGGIEKIPSPVLINYKLKDLNQDGIDDLVMKIGQISGDNSVIESIQLNGKYSKHYDGIKIVTE